MIDWANPATQIVVGIVVCLVFNLSVGALVAVQRWKLRKDRERCLVPITHNSESPDQSAD